MNGGIKVDVKHLSLKELNAIIIAVENNCYSIIPKVGTSDEFELFLIPTGTENERYGDSDINLLLCKLAPEQFGSCNEMKQAAKSYDHRSFFNK